MCIYACQVRCCSRRANQSTCVGQWVHMILSLFRQCGVTPSSHIYPSNHANRVNMRQEATMIGFDLLRDLKEVESMKDINQPIHISDRIPRRHVNYSDILSLGPTDVLDILRLNLSHAIGVRASRNPKSLSQACLPASRDPIFQCYASDPGI